MKNSLITYLLGFFFLISCFKSFGINYLTMDTAECLQIEGLILNANENIDQDCIVELYCSANLIKSITLKDGKKKFRFLLKKNFNYTIRISKKTYVTKVLCVDTKMNKDPYGMKVFEFETSLIESYTLPKSKRECLDFPIALIYYDSSKDCFVHDKEYTNRMKKDIAMN